MQQDNNSGDDVEFVVEDGEGAEIGKTDKIKKLRERIKELEEQVKENMDGWQRARADYVNLQKTSAEDIMFAKTRATESMIQDLLPVLDAFDAAMGNKESWEAVNENWRIGIEYIYQQLQSVLKEHGVEELAQDTGELDHNKYESIDTVETDDKKLDGTIAGLVQKGYVLKDRIIRTGKVRVYTKQ